LALSGAAMLREWKWGNRRGTPVLSVFAMLSAILAYIQFKANGGVRWLIGGTIILASWPYAYFMIMPVNVWLFVIPQGTAVSPPRKLMRDRGLLEWGHVLIGFAAACVFAWALELPL
jgi:hypothetical protein